MTEPLPNVPGATGLPIETATASQRLHRGVDAGTVEQQIIPLHAEDVSVAKRKIERNVRLHVHTVTHDHLIDEALQHESIEIERVSIGRPIDVAPPVREEGDTTVISIVEEIVVVERRMVLKEEIRLRRMRTTDRHRETVTLRQEQVVVDRAYPGMGKSGPPAELAPIPKAQLPRSNSE